MIEIRNGERKDLAFQRWWVCNDWRTRNRKMGFQCHFIFSLMFQCCWNRVQLIPHCNLNRIETKLCQKQRQIKPYPLSQNKCSLKALSIQKMLSLKRFMIFNNLIDMLLLRFIIYVNLSPFIKFQVRAFINHKLWDFLPTEKPQPLHHKQWLWSNHKHLSKCIQKKEYEYQSA